MLGRCCTPLTGTFEGAIDCFGFPPFLPPPLFFFPYFFFPRSLPHLSGGAAMCDHGVETNMSLLSMPPLKETK